jgi:NAD(P)H-dependent FMN reductase
MTNKMSWRRLAGDVRRGCAMSEDPLRVAIIVGSTREGRFGDTVARWFTTQARQCSDMALDVIDLVDLDLPMVYPAMPGPAVQVYIERIDRADAFVVVTPEYNHGYPASLKQAIDLPRAEWREPPPALDVHQGPRGQDGQEPVPPRLDCR